MAIYRAGARGITNIQTKTLENSFVVHYIYIYETGTTTQDIQEELRIPRTRTKYSTAHTTNLCTGMYAYKMSKISPQYLHSQKRDQKDTACHSL